VEVESSEGALAEWNSHTPRGRQPNWDQPTFATAPALATDGNQFFTAWWDASRTGRLYAARVSKQGKLLDPDSIPLNIPPTDFPSAPATAFDGKQFLVVWYGEFSLYLARVNRDGTLDGPYITLFTPSDHFPSGTPGLACSDRKCLVAWFTFGEAGGSGGVRGLAFRTDRPDLGRQEVFISTSLSAVNSYGIGVAWGHGRYLVAWTDSRQGTDDLLAARVLRDGTVLDPNGFTVSGGPGNQRYPAVTDTRDGFFVAWSEGQQGDANIFGARVKAETNTVLDPGASPSPPRRRRKSSPALPPTGTTSSSPGRSWRGTSASAASAGRGWRVTETCATRSAAPSQTARSPERSAPTWPAGTGGASPPTDGPPCWTSRPGRSSWAPA